MGCAAADPSRSTPLCGLWVVQVLQVQLLLYRTHRKYAEGEWPVLPPYYNTGSMLWRGSLGQTWGSPPTYCRYTL